ncbi:CoA-binding protein [Acidipila sp. EB88]|uniref:CoA-binding protein n=1 Tax=Acidipila sp. EB88 TaxID=2305226 RepID=UPI000F5F84A5|nr:CoA-binding protein [Acidipila sp. EB88]RRA49421.1 CoA-binding protein [Acidipila sp. EB88]
MNEPETIERILKQTKTIAVIGLSESPGRASAGVSRYLQQAGYRVIPVNPQIESALGEKAYPTLDDACKALKAEGISIDLVDVFRASTYVPEIVKDVMRLKIPAIWLQLGVCHEEAAEWAERDGVLTVMDRCIMQDHAAWKQGAGASQ